MAPLGAAEAPGPVTGLAMPRLQLNRNLQLTRFTAPFHITHHITRLAQSSSSEIAAWGSPGLKASRARLLLVLEEDGVLIWDTVY